LGIAYGTYGDRPPGYSFTSPSRRRTSGNTSHTNVSVADVTFKVTRLEIINNETETYETKSINIQR